MMASRRSDQRARRLPGTAGPDPRERGRDPADATDLVDALASAALLFDADGRLVASNGPARELLGHTANLHGRPSVAEVLGSDALDLAVARARRAQTLVHVDTVIDDRDVRSSVSPLGDDTLVVLTDQTSQRRVEELRRDFVVNASHELKTPAASILALSEALDITLAREPDRAPDLVGRLRDEAQRLVRVVHDLIDLRRLEEREALQPRQVDLAETARRVVHDQQFPATQRDIRLVLAAPAEAMLAADPDDLGLVVGNLVANAIQYNRDGGRVDVVVREAAGDTWILEVADTGIGIPQQDVGRIFERFYRVDVARSRETGGTGLGLSLVRHAVQRHGGTIEVDSELGQGTTIRVTLPVRQLGR